MHKRMRTHVPPLRGTTHHTPHTLPLPHGLPRRPRRRSHASHALPLPLGLPRRPRRRSHVKQRTPRRQLSAAAPAVCRLAHSCRCCPARRPPVARVRLGAGAGSGPSLPSRSTGPCMAARCCSFAQRCVA
eukprot:363269-Chlamydomonas_euryale.AAC.5